MSLWTPYADAPLDLTKVKEERRSPVAPEPVDCYYQYPQGIPPYYPGYQGYTYLPYNVPTAQMSPVSAGSSCSGCDSQSLLSPPYQRPPTLSPPESPQTQKSFPTEKISSLNYADKITSSNYMNDAEVLSDDPDFQAFERDALRAMAEKNGGTLLGNNPRMRRAVQTSQAVDDTYRKQRERNNFAAKQSRDRRKLREIHLALKVAYLKNEVGKLKAQLAVTNCSRCHRLCE